MTTYKANFPLEPLFPACPEDLLTEVSKELARPLPFPDDYLDFLRQWNGILVDEYESKYDSAYMVIVPFQDSVYADDHGSLLCLYGIYDASQRLDLRAARNAYAFEERVPSHMLSIGEDDHWNRVCMSLGEESYGHIMMWKPGEPWEPEGTENVQTEEHLHSVANSFAEFWNSLVTVDEYWKDRE